MFKKLKGHFAILALSAGLFSASLIAGLFIIYGLDKIF